MTAPDPSRADGPAEPPPGPPVPAPAPSPTADTGSRDAGDTSAGKALDLIGRVIAPTTVLTALAFYFGWRFTDARFSYFGIDASTLGFTTQEYLLRSTDALFVPLGAGLLAGLVGLLLLRRATTGLAAEGKQARVRYATYALMACGLPLLAFGIIGVWHEFSWPARHYVAASSGVGIALIACAAHLRRHLDAARNDGGPPAPGTGPRGHLGLVIGLIVLSAFWSASEYAKAIGIGRARDVAQSLSARAQVTVFAPKSLGIDVEGVVQTRLRGDGQAYRYRYTGLRLLIRSDGKYFLLPDGWTRSSGAAVVLADSPGRRFEFAPGDCGPGTPGDVDRCDDEARAASNEATVGEVAADVVTFGRVRVRRTRTQTIVLSVEGARPLPTVSIVGRHAADFHLRSAGCSEEDEDEERARCTLRVAFTPRSRGARRATIRVDTVERQFLQGVGVPSRRRAR